MYEYIRGTIAELSPAHAVIETQGGIAYFLNISVQTFSLLQPKEEKVLFTHFIVREDAQILYGFHDRSERELFRLLIGVSGVGGNTARMILSTFTADELRTVIATGKAEVLKMVKGLGLKTAQKIIVELKDKVLAVGDSAPLDLSVMPGGDTEEALAALTMLGFARGASEKVLRQIMKEEGPLQVEELIRTALKRL